MGEMVLESGKIWLRYVGSIGPKARTLLGVLRQGEPALAKPGDVDHLMTNGEWQIVALGRCHETVEETGERCMEEAVEGAEFCAMHSKEGVNNDS